MDSGFFSDDVSAPDEADVSAFESAVDVPEFPPLCPQPDNTIAPANANAVSFPYILFLMHMSSLLLYCYIIFSFSLYFPHPEIHFRQFSATTFICPVSRFL